jgi:hypothetical protein
MIHLFTSAMGQQVSKDIRSRLEHYTLEELLSDDKVISFSSLGEFRRLTAPSILRSFNGISQGCPRDRTLTLQKFYHYGRIHYPRTVIQHPSLIHRLRAGIHRPRTGIPEHRNLVHYGPFNPRISASPRMLRRYSNKTIVIFYASRLKTVLSFSLRWITTNTRVLWKQAAHLTGSYGDS